MLDKPSFLWAGGWYLKALYCLLGVEDNPWNISLNPRLDTLALKPQYNIYFNGTKTKVKVTGQGKYLKNISYDGKTVCSAVMPAQGKRPENIHLELGKPSAPYLKEANIIIQAVQYNAKDKSITIKGKGFPAHTVKLSLVSLTAPKRVEVDGLILKEGVSSEPIDGVVNVSVGFQQKAGNVKAVIYF